jgi:putative acetyltransferase
MDIVIDYARGEGDIIYIRELFTEYQEWLGVDLCFQGFDQELLDLPGKYAEPRGCMLLAREGEAIAGCVAVWPLDDGVCEMKRLYVRPPWRGRGLGRRLAVAIIAESKKRHYSSMRLDTLPQLKAALALYRDLGFSDTEAYYDNPLDGVSYLELDLER